MQLRNSAQGYGSIPKSVHWFTVALVVVAWFLGTFGDDLPRGTARDVGMFLHVTAGLLIIVLLVVRILWRFGDAPPPAETTPLGGWIEAAGKLTHLALYVLLAATPILGIISRMHPRITPEQFPDRPKIRRRTSVPHQAGWRGRRASYFPVSVLRAALANWPLWSLASGERQPVIVE